jgi:hypothetical protein
MWTVLHVSCQLSSGGSSGQPVVSTAFGPVMMIPLPAAVTTLPCTYCYWLGEPASVGLNVGIELIFTAMTSNDHYVV